MLRALRQNTKWIFYILAVSFVGWLVFDVGMGITGRGSYGGQDVVLKVDGQAVHLPQYNAALQSAYEQARRQSGGRLTREDEEQVQNQVVDQIVQQLLLQREYQRLGITVSDDELIQAARSSPPPDVLRIPEFQTDGQFDITKWQRYIQSADPQFLQQLEIEYRKQIPQSKLAEYLTADVFVSDAKLWRIWRDQRESVTVSLVALRPEQISDADAPVSDVEIQRYYDAHKGDYKQPAVAYLSFIAAPRAPDAADTAAAVARARQLRAEASASLAKFTEVAKRESADSVSGAKGGDLGWIKRDQPDFDLQFLAGLKRVAVGEVSPPVPSRFGYHLIRVDAARGDSVHARHILVPIALHGAHLDAVEARADTLDRLAADQANGAVLDSVAARMRLHVARAPRLVQGDRLMLGRYVIPDVGVWAFEGHVGETSPVIEGELAYYVFRLDSLVPAHIATLAESRAQVVDVVRREKQREVARQRAATLAAQQPPQRLGPFTRLSPPAVLAREPLVLGAAFGLRPGERSPLIAGQSGFFQLQGIKRTTADSGAWAKQRDAQREAILRAARQARLQSYVAALRAQAKIVDRRKEIFKPQPPA